MQLLLRRADPRDVVQLTFGAGIEQDVKIQDVDRFPHFAAKWAPLELVNLDRFSGLLPLPRVSPFRHLALVRRR